MSLDALIDKVTEKTKGTKGDPLTREEVEQIVKATVDALEDDLGRELTPEEPVVPPGMDPDRPEAA